MPTKKQIFSEIKNLLKVYDQQGLIDDITLNNWFKHDLKQFGGNIMNEYQQVLIVENGRAKLPDNFWALKTAVKCEDKGYVEEKIEKHAQSRVSYLEWTDIRDYYNYLEGKPCLEDEDSKYITETLYFETKKKAYTFYYDTPVILNLKPHIHKVRCDKNSPNLYSDSKYDISIDENHNYITTNFNSGFIWVWYRGLPCDEKGDLMVPNTSRDKLKLYIIYNGVVKMLEQIWLNEDDLNLITKLQYFSPLRDKYFYEAKSESINKGMKGWSTRLINNNRKNSNKFERMFRSLDPTRPLGRGFTQSIN